MHLLASLAFTGILSALVHADTYLHYPRGSNNRQAEKSATRQTNNRVFDSQNNARGGYNVGVREAKQNANKPNEQYAEKWFASTDKAKTYLPVRWTSQHGSGGDEDTNPNKLNSNFVIQMMCEDDPDDGDDTITDSNKFTKMRNGLNTNTQDYEQPRQEYDRTLRRNVYKENENSFTSRRNSGVKGDRVLQEPFEWHDKCRVRERNKGLFTADQRLTDNIGATATRQNPNGQRSGYECPEERDHYPYWHPTPWVDVMVYAKNASMCDYYKKESFNVKSKWECVEKFRNSDKFSHYSNFNNKDDCISAGAIWHEFHQALEIMKEATTKAACDALKTKYPGKKFIWGTPINLNGDISPKCLAQADAPGCAEYPFGRVNHLGNGAEGVEEIGYDMPLPNFPSGTDKRCVLRTRYNITTDDYDGWALDASFSDTGKSNGRSPVYNNPNVYFGALEPLALAMNTTQFGRTFQDRSHIFRIQKRPAGMENSDIKILSVQGKRGNIVQTYPAVEYDFVPKKMEVRKNDLIHIQWTGSNTHNNNNPGGDGQTGDAGEGEGGTDRSNMLGMMERLGNWPLPDVHKDNFINHMEVKWSDYNPEGAPEPKDLAIQLATSGFYKSQETAGGGMQNQLNNASPTFKGAIIQMKDAGNYHYMCTRNNNFSNRSQKGSILVK